MPVLADVRLANNGDPEYACGYRSTGLTSVSVISGHCQPDFPVCFINWFMLGETIDG